MHECTFKYSHFVFVCVWVFSVSKWVIICDIACGTKLSRCTDLQGMPPFFFHLKLSREILWFGRCKWGKCCDTISAWSKWLSAYWTRQGGHAQLCKQITPCNHVYIRWCFHLIFVVFKHAARFSLMNLCSHCCGFFLSKQILTHWHE